MTFDTARRFERVDIPLEVRMKNVSSKNIVRTNDISMGGCYIQTIESAAVGEHVDFEMEMPTGGWLPLRGEVIYQHPNIGFGIRFTDLSEQAQNKLARLIIECVLGSHIVELRKFIDDVT